MDTFILAMSRFRRRDFEATIQHCNQLLQNNPQDQAAQLLKMNSLIKQQYIDDLEVEDEGAGDILLDENNSNPVAKPGTSFQGGQNPKDTLSQVMRPQTKSGRLTTGFARPGSQRPISSQGGKVQTALQNGQRTITAGGRYLRISTASLIQSGDQDFIQVDKLNLKSIAQKKIIAKPLCDYLLYVEHNPRKALELAAESTKISNYTDWWWKERLGKCYFMLGMYREAEKQLKSSIQSQDMIKTQLELTKVFIKIDQPLNAIQVLKDALSRYPDEISFILGIARIHDMLNEQNLAVKYYKNALSLESCNLEAIACIASYHFYIEQPEIALRLYKILVLLGVNSAELWNNMALCCYYDGQYDMFWSSFEKALQLSDDSNKADIWYNISQIFCNNGELDMAEKALKLSIQADPTHAESYNNLGVLEMKKDKMEEAKYDLDIAHKEGAYLYQPLYNAAIIAYKHNDLQETLRLLQKTLEVFPELQNAKELYKELEEILNIL